MNFRLVFKITGRVLQVEAATMLPPLVVALIYHESLRPFLISIAVLLIVGTLLNRLPNTGSFYNRDGFFTIGVIWLFVGFFGAFPFYFSGCFPSFVDCLFESYSGFTTTGATILAEIESLPRGILFWRSFTHWLGGVGVLALSSIVLPALGVKGQYLSQAETPGPVFSKMVPRQAVTTRITYTIYLILTGAEIGALLLAHMPLYDAFIHAFSSAGTGGFSNLNRSVGGYDSVAIEMIIAVFVLLFSVNFSMYFLLYCRRIREVFQSSELRFFLGVVAVSTVAIALDILPVYHSVGQAFRYSFFQVASIISTTGFSSVDFTSQWPQFAQMVLILLMIIGACSGSTGGGMKCSRILILIQCIRREVRRIIHPRMVSVVKLDGKVVEEDNIHTVLVFAFCYFLITLGATLVLSVDNFSFATSFSAALTCISNTGPGLETVGASGNFLGFSPLSKIVLSLCMVIGRLEIFPVLVLFSKQAWRKA